MRKPSILTKPSPKSPHDASLLPRDNSSRLLEFVTDTAPEPGEDHSIRIADKTHGLVDLDARMNEMPELRSELAERLADQLARIGYTDEALAGLRT